MDVYFDDFVYALGGQTYSLPESAKASRLKSSPEALEDAGFARHHVCAEEETAYTLARTCADQIKDRLPGVGVIIYSTCLPMNGNCGDPDSFRSSRDVKHLMDFPASRLQAEYGLDQSIVIGLNQQACTGMLGSLRIAKMFLQEEPQVKKALCVTADRFPSGALYEQSYNLISDGGAACIASRESGRFRLLVSHALTNGGLSFASDEEVMGTYFGYTHKVISETLQKAQLQTADIAWIVPQNMNAKGLQILCRLLKFDPARLHAATREAVGHVISGDNVLNLRSLLDSGALKKNDKILLVMAGYGLNWQCCVMEYCGDE